MSAVTLIHIIATLAFAFIACMVVWGGLKMRSFLRTPSKSFDGFLALAISGPIIGSAAMAYASVVHISANGL